MPLEELQQAGRSQNGLRRGGRAVRQRRQAVPGGVLVVSESGIGSTEQLRQLEREGVDAVLVGESLMRAPDPAQALDALLEGDQRYRD